MKMVRIIGVLSAAALFLAAFSAPVQASEKLTVGEFVQMVASAHDLPSASAEQAAASLNSAGYALPKLDNKSTLTEGKVVAISKSLGLNLSTSNPGDEFDRSAATAYVASLGGSFGRGGEPGAGEESSPMKDPFPTPGTNKGKGKKKGHFKSPSEPE